MELGGTVFQMQRAGLARGLGGAFFRLVHGSIQLRPFRTFIQLNDARIRNFPAERLDVSLLLVALFQKNGLA